MKRIALVIAMVFLGLATSNAQDYRATSTKVEVSGQTQVLVGAGDIAGCADLSGAEATAQLLDSIRGTIFANGDLVYPDGTKSQFDTCYQSTWGRFERRTRPAVGNHEYNTPDAAGYFDYFGKAAHPPEGYYSYDLGSWHIIVLNTNCSEDPGVCKAGSAQEKWLKADLLAHPTECQLAYFHEALFSSGERHPDERLRPIWNDLYAAGVDVVVNGHVHNYERFAPQDPDAKADPVRGIREFIVGTGGKSHQAFVQVRPNSEVRNNDSYGVLKLVLSPGRYTWQFIPVAGASFTDSGHGDCHGDRPTERPSRVSFSNPSSAGKMGLVH
ncbi:MAG: metallophosphoesterase [Acidobacteriaceae bacterium]